MAKEILTVPEEKLQEVVDVIMVGLMYVKNFHNISTETKEQLRSWCERMRD